MSNVQIRQIGEIDHWVRHRMCKKLTLGHDSAAKKTLSKVARHLAAPGSLRSSPRVLPMSLRCFFKRQADRSLRGTLCPLSLRGASPRCRRRLWMQLREALSIARVWTALEKRSSHKVGMVEIGT